MAIRKLARIYALATVVLVAVGIAAAASASVGSSPLASKIRANRHIAATDPHPQAVSAGPGACGPWSSNDSSGNGLTRRFGVVRDCELVGTTWVITTEATSSAKPGVLMYRCGKGSSCLDGRNGHAVAGWRYYPSPYDATVTILQVPDPNTLILDSGGHEIEFKINSGSYVGVIR